MPAFVRDAGVWKESVPLARNGSAWTDEDDQLYVRDGGEWKLIYPDPADAGDLLPVEGLAVTSGPNHFSVTIGWTNPTQPTITPTAVQVRIAELGAVWTELDYPVTAYAWSALDASTEYFAQVRLIRRVDGIVTDVSPVKSVQFTTTAAPIGAPAEDPGSPGGTSTIFPLGGSTGNPTAPSTPDGCWWEWKLQILDQDTTTINWQDTGITGTEDGDADDITYDTTSLDNTRTYRMCIREACDTNSDGTADDFGDWSCSEPFAGAFDWGVTCGSVPLAPVVELDAAADAVWAFPRYCAVGDGLDTTGIVDAISNTQIGKGADMAAIYTTTDGEWGVVADADGGITLTAGLAAITTNVGAGLDFTIVARRRLSPGHSFSNGRTTTIASVGGGAIVIQAVETATGWYPTVSFRLTSGYVTLSGSGDEITSKGSVHTIALRWDADGDKKLALDGTEVDSDTSGDDLHASVTVQPMYWTAEVGLGSTMQQIGWDRVITDEELAEFSFTFDGIAWELIYDPSDSTGITLSGGQVSAWISQGSDSRVMAPAVDPPQLGVRANVNGNVMMDLDGTNDWLQVDGSGFNVPAVAGEGLVTLLVAQIDDAGDCYLFDKFNTNAAGGHWGLARAGGNLIAIWASPSSVGHNAAVSYSSTSLAVFGQRVIRNGASSVNQLWLNGSKVAETAYTDGMATYTGSEIITIGIPANITSFCLDGGFGGAWAMRGEVLSETQMTAAMQALMSRFGI